MSTKTTEETKDKIFSLVIDYLSTNMDHKEFIIRANDILDEEIYS